MPLPYMEPLCTCVATTTTTTHTYKQQSMFDKISYSFTIMSFDT